ncbi:ER membrane protein complex subunit 8 [Podochytrium sp. JEL0797]|nr:ER membrane protein complex subunit 8 [Podochytrium sp. JEL0797]
MSKISATAHAKLVLHAAKYPSLSVFGILLGTSAAHITDAVPVQHDFVALSSILEASLDQIKIHAARTQTRIIGCYTANARLEDMSVSRLTAHMAHEVDKLAGGNSVLVVLDNDKMLVDVEEYLGVVAFKETNGVWKPVPKGVTFDGEIAPAVAKLRKCLQHDGQMKIYDFDNHLDNAGLDWLKNGEVEEVLAKA